MVLNFTNENIQDYKTLEHLIPQIQLKLRNKIEREILPLVATHNLSHLNQFPKTGNLQENLQASTKMKNIVFFKAKTN